MCRRSVAAEARAVVGVRLDAVAVARPRTSGLSRLLTMPDNAFQLLFQPAFSSISGRYGCRRRITLVMLISQCGAVRRCSSNDETHSPTTSSTVSYCVCTVRWGADALPLQSAMPSMPSMPSTPIVPVFEPLYLHRYERASSASFSQMLL